MKVYVSIHEDRHTDVDVRVFETLSVAVYYAKQVVERYDYDESEDVSDWSPPPEWLFHAYLSCEGDTIRVEEKEVTGA